MISITGRRVFGSRVKLSCRPSPINSARFNSWTAVTIWRIGTSLSVDGVGLLTAAAAPTESTLGISMTCPLVSISAYTLPISRNFMTSRYVAGLLALLAAPVWPQTGQTQDDAMAKQRNAAAAMQDSLAKQQAAVQKQTQQTGTGSFFVLPHAASLGTVTGSVSAPIVAPALVPGCDPLPPGEVESLVGETAERDGLSADLLRTVMKQESGFRPCAVSPKGAMGLMQLMPATAEQLGIEIGR